MIVVKNDLCQTFKCKINDHQQSLAALLQLPIARVSDVRPIFIFAICNFYVLLSFLNSLGKPEKLYCTGFGQANAEIRRFEEH